MKTERQEAKDNKNILSVFDINANTEFCVRDRESKRARARERERRKNMRTEQYGHFKACQVCETRGLHLLNLALSMFISCVCGCGCVCVLGLLKLPGK